MPARRATLFVVGACDTIRDKGCRTVWIFSVLFFLLQNHTHTRASKMGRTYFLLCFRFCGPVRRKSFPSFTSTPLMSSVGQRCVRQIRACPRHTVTAFVCFTSYLLLKPTRFLFQEAKREFVTVECSASITKCFLKGFLHFKCFVNSLCWNSILI